MIYAALLASITGRKLELEYEGELKCWRRCRLARVDSGRRRWQVYTGYFRGRECSSDHVWRFEAGRIA